MQEYPLSVAAAAPMDATFEVGLNVYGNPIDKELNTTVPVPVFYAGGEITPLPELPFQAVSWLECVKYLAEVNQLKKDFSGVLFENKDNWEDPIWGLPGDRIEEVRDESRDDTLTIHYFDSKDGVCRSALASVANQLPECRHHSCEEAWKFISKFTR